MRHTKCKQFENEYYWVLKITKSGVIVAMVFFFHKNNDEILSSCVFWIGLSYFKYLNLYDYVIEVFVKVLIFSFHL